ncbi:hypothetical protein [Micromonospora coerulea]|uniref:hypothetical protein n=1 Tax=Micromonospora coerulea TaxID=47856 RepID=UPI00190773C7|nr:hypothetical protein [Micromonospora veneta]
MASETGSGALRELLLVVAVAGAGLVLAVVAAFGHWYPTSDQAARAGLVETHSTIGQPGGPTAS